MPKWKPEFRKNPLEVATGAVASATLSLPPGARLRAVTVNTQEDTRPAGPVMIDFVLGFRRDGTTIIGLVQLASGWYSEDNNGHNGWIVAWQGNLPLPTDYEPVININIINDTGSTIKWEVNYLYERRVD